MDVTGSPGIVGRFNPSFVHLGKDLLAVSVMLESQRYPVSLLGPVLKYGRLEPGLPFPAAVRDGTFGWSVEF